MGYKQWKIQVQNQEGESIISSGGVCMVVENGEAKKVTLYSDKIGTSLGNPLTMTRGMIEFWASDTLTSVDLYGMSPTGESFVRKDVTPMGPNEIRVNQDQRHHVLVIPFDHEDYTAATETDTGFDTGTDKEWLPFPVVWVEDIDTGETIDVGTTTGTTDDPDGFIDGISVAAAGAVRTTITNGSITLGQLLLDTAGASADEQVPSGIVMTTSDDITLTLSTGTDTAAGFIHLPYLNMNT